MCGNQFIKTPLILILRTGKVKPNTTTTANTEIPTQKYAKTETENKIYKTQEKIMFLVKRNRNNNNNNRKSFRLLNSRKI